MGIGTEWINTHKAGTGCCSTDNFLKVETQVKFQTGPTQMRLEDGEVEREVQRASTTVERKGTEEKRRQNL